MSSVEGAILRRNRIERIEGQRTKRPAAARAAGIGVNTLLRWMKDPEFDKAYRKARRTAFGQGTARLQQASGVAVSTVLKIMLDQHAPASTKLRAADMVLTHGAKAIEIEDVEARVSELERAAEESKKTR
jgi:hypothetical protein